MTTRIEIYRGHQLTGVKQPNGNWMVEMVPVVGVAKPFLTEAHHDQDQAFAAARQLLDTGFNQ